MWVSLLTPLRWLQRRCYCLNAAAGKHAGEAGALVDQILEDLLLDRPAELDNDPGAKSVASHIERLARAARDDIDRGDWQAYRGCLAMMAGEVVTTMADIIDHQAQLDAKDSADRWRAWVRCQHVAGGAKLFKWTKMPEAWVPHSVKHGNSTSAIPAHLLQAEASRLSHLWQSNDEDRSSLVTLFATLTTWRASLSKLTSFARPQALSPVRPARPSMVSM